MASVIRNNLVTRAATDFPDNRNEQITAKKLRDFLVDTANGALFTDEVPPADVALRYDMPQPLTEPQKAQARDNIGFDAALPTRPFAVPIGGSGTGQVPADLRARFKHFANAVTDFGVSLYETDGVTLKNNATALQTAIDKLQAYNGALFFPQPENGVQAVLTGPLVMRDTTGYKGKAVCFEALGAGEPSRLTRDFTVPVDERFTVGMTLKLAPGSSAAMLTSPPEAGHFMARNINFDGNSSQQAAPRRILNIVDRLSGYGSSVVLDTVSFRGSQGAAVAIGVNRAITVCDNVFIEGCGASGGEPAFSLNCYDAQIFRIAIGNSPGVGLYVGITAQLEIEGGAIWNSGESNLVTSSSALTFRIAGVNFDGSGNHNTIVNDYAVSGDTREPMHHFANCMWTFRNNNPFTNPTATPTNTYDDIINYSRALVLTAPKFHGNADNGTSKSRYNVGMVGAAARARIVNASYRGGVSHVTSFTNDWGKIIGFVTDDAATNSTRYFGTTFQYMTDQFAGSVQSHTDGTPISALSSSTTGGKAGWLRLFDAAGSAAVSLGASITDVGDPRFPYRTFANDAAAAAANPPVPVGSIYYNSTIGALRPRIT